MPSVSAPPASSRSLAQSRHHPRLRRRRQALAGAAPRRYNPAMRRRIGLIVAILVIVAAAYSGFWWIAAGRIADGVAAWAAEAKADGLAVTWRDLRVAGYPLWFRVELADFALDDAASPLRPELRAASLSARAHPWAYRDWTIAAPQGIEARLGGVGRLGAATAAGAVSVGEEGGAAVWLDLADAQAEAAAAADGHVAARTADFWAIVPARPPAGHDQPDLGLAVDLRGLSVPEAPPGFAPAIDELALGATVMGPIPAGVPRRAAAAWRDAGGTVELDHFRLVWGGLKVAASGTLALDQDLQPIAAFSGTVSGFDAVIAALVASGRMSESDGRLARLGLSLLAKPGPDGKPELASSLTVQNGEIYLGPAKLGPAPRLVW